MFSKNAVSDCNNFINC